MSVATLDCMHMNHLNLVVDGFDASVGRFGELFGARLNLDIPKPEWHAALLSVGNVIFEVIAPTEFLPVARYGPHWLGIEYQVGDVEHARRSVTERGIRIVRDIGGAFHTHPNDTFGVAFEFYNGNFHTNAHPGPGDSGPAWLEPLMPLEYWRDEHALGCIGLKRYSVVVADLAGATTFFTDFLGASPLYAASRPSAADAVGLALADSVIELLTPTGAGPVQDHLRRYGEGIRSTVLHVADGQRARQHFHDLGVATAVGDSDDAFTIAVADSCDVIFEFAE